ncbi:MAG TPA: protein phosphatase 2C domain-containing protein [Actinopolymorphaceae bacterium]|jgi:protein phosphatase
MRFTFSVESHVGYVRTNNEDSAFAGPHLLLVADGVGGAAAGEIASASVAYVMSAISMSPKAPLQADPSDVLGVLRESIEFAHNHLKEGVAENPVRSGMATTLTAVLTDGQRFGLAHLGDSRAYLMRGGQLSRLTTDHTFAQTLVDDGHITEEEAAVHPFRSAVVRNVNGEDPHEPDLALIDLQVGDRLLLCSDGLTDLVPDDMLAGYLSDPSPDLAVRNLVQSALQAGGQDNVTCVVADVDPRELMPWSRRCYYCRMAGAVTDLGNLIDPAAVSTAA